MIGSIVISILLNAVLLEKYYIFKNKSILEGYALQINAEMDNGLKDLVPFIEELDRENAVAITVADESLIILASSYFPQKESNSVPKEIETMITSGITYGAIDKENAQPKLVYILKAGGKYIAVSKPLKGIAESVGISNQFYIIAGLFTLLVGSIFMFRFSGRVTKPIIEMGEIADDIANLNFERKVTVRSDDELGTLAKNINTTADKLKVSIEGLRKDIEFQKNLARNMSHELKTPIGVIKGYAEGIKYGVADTEESADSYCDIIVSECDRMNEMVTEMLDLSALEAKDRTLENVSTFELLSLILTLVERFDFIFKENKIAFSYECEKDLMITADYELLQRAVSNIVMNAVKYNDEHKAVILRALSEQGKVCISVFNTGIGIPDSQLDKIWDVFYKVDTARSRKMGGHGLGLAIVKSIVTLHHGTVTAQNTKDGIEFAISIPLPI